MTGTVKYLYFILILLISIIWSLLSRFIIDFYVGENYRGAYSYVIWLSLSYAFTGMHMMVVNYIYYMKKVKLYSVVTFSVMIINVILNLFFISEFGSVGAAEATLISNVLSFIFTWALANRVFPMPWIKRNDQ